MSSLPEPGTWHLEPHFLLHAQRLAARGLGRTCPNPTVGCVIVKDGAIVGAARTADGGRPHAEALALTMAGEKARGATAYVTLEPCAHHGQTPPCAEALIRAGVARVVVGSIDPDPRVSGQGIAMLQAAGIEVQLTQHAPLTDLNRGFFRRIRHGLPHTALKLATSLDGCITDAAGRSQWITSPAARSHAHALRATFDCLITGIGTVLADDPQLSVRAPHRPHPGLIRVVCDRRLRLPLPCQLVRTATRQPTWVITTAEAVEQAASHATELREAGVVVLAVDAVTPDRVLRALAAAGITRALIEAGSTLSTAFLAENAVETLHWYRAPILLGNAGKSAVAVLDSSLETVARYALHASQKLGDNVYERYELKECSPD